MQIIPNISFMVPFLINVMTSHDVNQYPIQLDDDMFKQVASNDRLFFS